MTKNEMGAALEKPSGAPTWLILVLGMGGLGGLGLGGAQLARAPADIDDKLTALVSQVAGVSTKIDVLTTQVQARDKTDDPDHDHANGDGPWTRVHGQAIDDAQDMMRRLGL